MNRILLVFLACALTAAGCMSNFPAHKDSLPRPTAQQRPPSVYPDEVNAGNAHAMAAALEAELDFDAHADEAKALAR